jgi:polyhydroxybutyrate depolymerase
MAGMGPRPKPADRRRRRNPVPGTVYLPAEGYQGEIPPWPLPARQSEMVRWPLALLACVSLVAAYAAGTAEAQPPAAKVVYVHEHGSNANHCTKAAPCLAVAEVASGVNPDTSGVKKLFVSPMGSNTNPCTPSAPCLRIEAVHADYGAEPTPSSSPPPAGSTGCGQPQPAGRFTRSLTVGRQQRSYVIEVPAGLDPHTPVPVLMAFHGGNWMAADFADSTGLTSTEAALYVYPQGRPFADAWAGWNVDPAGADFPFVEAVLGDLNARHCVDMARVLAAGRSNGGFFANSLLCNRPNLFKAAASVAGGGPEHDCTQPSAFMGVHGTADTAVPISTGRFSRDYWLAANQHNRAAPVRTDPPPCVTYPGTINHPVVWCEHDGGHGWPAWTGPAVRSWFLGLN